MGILRKVGIEYNNASLDCSQFKSGERLFSYWRNLFSLEQFDNLEFTTDCNFDYLIKYDIDGSYCGKPTHELTIQLDDYTNKDKPKIIVCYWNNDKCNGEAMIKYALREINNNLTVFKGVS